MEFSTKWETISLEVLESVLYNAENAIPKMKVELEFEDEAKYNKFINRYNPNANEEDDVISSGQSADEDLEDSDPDAKGDEFVNSEYEEVKHTETLAKLEESIVLKQYYGAEIASIGVATHVRILIVPKKIKYFGKDQSDIEEALMRIYQIRKNINIYSLPNFGLQLTQSKHYKQVLGKEGILIGKKAENYYYWYDESKISTEQRVNELKNKIFFDSFHKFYPLRLDTTQFLSEPYSETIIKFNGKLFAQNLSKYMNEDYLVEISESETDLVIHCDVEEQAAMPEHELKTFFKNLVYFFVTYEVEYEEEEGQQKIIENITEVEKKLDEFGIHWHRNKHILVIGFNRKSEKQNQHQVHDQTFLPEKWDRKQFLDNMEQIFRLNKNCIIEIPESDDTDLDRDQVESGSKKYTVEYRKFEHIWCLMPKNKKETILKAILDKHIMSPVFDRKIKKQNDTPKKTKPGDVSLTFNKDSQINDTSLVNGSVVIEDSFTSQAGKKHQGQNFSSSDSVLTKQLQNKFSEKLADYKFKIVDALGTNKYTSDTETIAKMRKSKLNEEFDSFLCEVTRQKFRSSDVEVPTQFQRSLQQENIVTVFVSNNEFAKFYKDQLSVKLIQKWGNSIGNGWLVNTPKQNLIEEDGKIVINQLNYEIVKFLRFVK